MLDQTAGMERYLPLSTDEKRFTALPNFSQEYCQIFSMKWKSYLTIRQNEFEISNLMLQEVYSKLFDEFHDRLSKLKVLKIK